MKTYNNNNLICDSKAYYSGDRMPTGWGATGPRAQGAGMGGGGGMSSKHIEQQTDCKVMKPIKKGDLLHTVAEYDLERYSG